jgi:hypothetical protein
LDKAIKDLKVSSSSQGFLRSVFDIDGENITEPAIRELMAYMTTQYGFSAPEAWEGFQALIDGKELANNAKFSNFTDPNSEVSKKMIQVVNANRKIRENSGGQGNSSYNQNNQQNLFGRRALNNAQRLELWQSLLPSITKEELKEVESANKNAVADRSYRTENGTKMLHLIEDNIEKSKKALETAINNNASESTIKRLELRHKYANIRKENHKINSNINNIFKRSLEGGTSLAGSGNVQGTEKTNIDMSNLDSRRKITEEEKLAFEKSLRSIIDSDDSKKQRELEEKLRSLLDFGNTK